MGYSGGSKDERKKARDQETKRQKRKTKEMGMNNLEERITVRGHRERGGIQVSEALETK